MSNSPASPCPPVEAGREAASRDWMLAMLKELMLGMMAADLPILTKANAVARLGNLYLRTDNAAELKWVNAELVEQLTEMGERVATLEAERAAGSEQVAGRPVAAAVGTITRAIETAAPLTPRSNGTALPVDGRHSEPRPQQKAPAPDG